MVLPALCASSRWAIPGLRTDGPPTSFRLRRTDAPGADAPGADALVQGRARQLLIVLSIYYALVFAF